jgi:hypothetical protein
MRRVWAAALALVLASCGTISDILAPYLPRDPPAQPAPDPEPAYRQLIAESMRGLFANGADPRSVSISREVRRAQLLDGPAWRVCLRADTKNMNGQYVGTQTYVIAIRRNKITDRRRAEREDGCDAEAFEAFNF